MTFSLAQQTLVFLEAILLGVIGGFIYDICRAIRQIMHFKTKGTIIIDSIFWLILLIILFYFAVTDAVSQMRFYVILGEIGGMLLYFLSFTTFINSGLIELSGQRASSTYKKQSQILLSCCICLIVLFMCPGNQLII